MYRIFSQVAILVVSCAIAMAQSDNKVAEKFAADLLSAKTDEERQTLVQQNKERLTTDLVRELNKQGRTLFSQGKYPQAIEVYQVGLNVAGLLNDKAGSALILIGVGNANYVQGNYPKAQEAYQQSLKFAEDAGNKSDIARAQSSLGTLHWAQGNYQTALELYEKSMKVRKELGDNTGIASLLGNMAGIFYQQGDY